MGKTKIPKELDRAISLFQGHYTKIEVAPPKWETKKIEGFDSPVKTAAIRGTIDVNGEPADFVARISVWQSETEEEAHILVDITVECYLFEALVLIARTLNSKFVAWQNLTCEFGERRLKAFGVLATRFKK